MITLVTLEFVQIIYLIQDIAIILAIGGIILAIFNKIKQPPVIAYLIAGILLSPNTFPLQILKEKEFLFMISFIGIIFLMFTIGVEFPIARIRKYTGIIFITTLIEIFFTIIVLYFISKNIFGWNIYDSFFIALSLSISSTVIIGKVLYDYKLIKEEFALIMFGILIIEDIIAAIMITILENLFLIEFTFIDFASRLVMIALFIGLIILGGGYLIPKIIDKIGKENKEMLLAACSALVFGISYIGSLFNINPLTGAFLVGIAIAASKIRNFVNEIIMPIRDLFSIFFFISIGTFINIKIIPNFIYETLLLGGILIGIKFLSITYPLIAFKYKKRIAIKSGLGIAQPGEFSLIIAFLGINFGLINPFILYIVILVTIITSFITPFLIIFKK